MQIRKHHARKMLVHLLGRLHRLRLGFFNDRIDHISLAARRRSACLRKLYTCSMRALLHVLGDDGLAARRHLIDHAHIQVAVDRQRQRARDGRRGHHQHVRMASLFHQFLALLHAEAMLLIDNGQPQLLELDVGFEQRVRPHHDLGQAGGHQLS